MLETTYATEKWVPGSKNFQKKLEIKGKNQEKSLVAGKRVQAHYHIRDVEKQPLVFCSSSSVFLFIFVLLFNLAG